MVDLMEYAKRNKDTFLSEGHQRRLYILNKVAGGEIWLQTGWLDVKGGRVRRHSWTSVGLKRFNKELQELDERVKGRIIYDGYLTFFINERVKNEMIKRNLWGVRKNSENYFGREEDEGEVVRFYFPVTLSTLRSLIQKLEELKNLKI